MDKMAGKRRFCVILAEIILSKITLLILLLHCDNIFENRETSKCIFKLDGKFLWQQL